MSHVLFGGPDGPTGWLIRLQPRTLADRLHPARMRDRLAAVDPGDYVAALDDLASGTPETLLRLGFTVTRTE
jgi:hypothetical protein